ncbi:NAD(P) transhydrogenase subunit alpha [Cyanobium sp. Morenito 9A2]|uniref:NAD(P) transhydrogenase subunit alpha n=1 Tax=Cyanobium sp. Morenito 9A2 TaxID=2823718 RepID=UPI0020CCA861|nr:NAD(P) transhydrogenase subunit alpha [Cyanobium sp. Morenito 9A2]MCP9849754.1 NAD(P) transhydrogenase subunit alpha [Cyanobium sp. Morenito 9A2]
MTTVLVPRERRSGETRVAATPETVKRLIARGARVWIEAEAGRAAGFSDAAFEEAGAEVFASSDSLERWRQADAVLAVQAPLLCSEGGDGGLEALPAGSLVLGLLDPYRNQALIDQLELGRVSSLALELLPRISRAQAMDVLSSQANIAGYKAVLLAAAALDRFFPMLMTAAGTVQPAKVVVLGAGVAGLQAVATARRLGAVVRVSDVRPAAREQVESLGARFIEPPQLEEAPGEAGGYAREAGAVFQEAQRQILAKQLEDADVVICTAQVPGRPAPLLITEAMLAGMRPGSVVVDLAVAQGGNCAASRAEADAWVGGVRVIGAGNLAATVPQHASALYARNLAALLEVVLKEGAIHIDPEDPLLDPCLLTHGGACRRPDLRPARQEATA